MVHRDIPTQNLVSRRSISLALSPFEHWALEHGYNTAPAVSPAPTRKYADRQTQGVLEAREDGATTVARMLTESTLDTSALRQRCANSPGRSINRICTLKPDLDLYLQR